MKTLFFLTMLFLTVQSRAQEGEQPEATEYAASCSLSVKTTVFKVEPSDVVGRASIEATLSDKSGTPISGQTIEITSTNGTFTCIAPNDFSGVNTADHSCFVTGPDGTILVYLVDIPFNKPGRLKATCHYGEFNVHASSRYSITHKVSRIKTSGNNSPASTQDQ